MGEYAHTEYVYTVRFGNWGEEWKLKPFGDVHHDADNHAKDHWKSYLDSCKKDLDDYKGRVIFLGMGDYIDYMSTSERAGVQSAHFHDTTNRTLDEYALEKTDKMLDQISFMKGKTIGLIEGNHHYKLMSGMTTTNYMCEKLQCKYLGIHTYVYLRMEKQGPHRKTVGVLINAHHGRGGGRTIGASLNAVYSLQNAAEADIYLMGDNHQKEAARRPILKKGHGNSIFRMRERQRIFARTGSFQKGLIHNQDSFVAKMAMAPTSLGAIDITMVPTRTHFKEDGEKKEETFIDMRVSY